MATVRRLCYMIVIMTGDDYFCYRLISVINRLIVWSIKHEETVKMSITCDDLTSSKIPKIFSLLMQDQENWQNFTFHNLKMFLRFLAGKIS